MFVVVTPILWDPVSPLIALVVTPEITTLSPFNKLCDVEIYADTVLESFQIISTLSYTL